MRHTKRLKIQGFTLTELAIVLLIAGTLFGGVWVAGESVWNSYRMHRSIQQITRLTQNVREYYMNGQALPGTGATIPVCGGTVPATNNITSYLDCLTLFPLEMRRNAAGGGGGALDHPFSNRVVGGSMLVQSVACFGLGGLTCFRVKMLGLTQQNCMRLLTDIPANDDELGIIQVGVNNMASSHLGDPPSAATLAVAQGWCNQGGTNNEVDWDFKLHH